MAATSWKIDGAHADVQFSAKHMMVTTVRGKFADVSGDLVLDEAEPGRSHGAFAVRTASLTTGMEQRDGHLRSPDFFDVATYPEITFVSTSVTARGRSDYEVTGDLTIRDITRRVSFAVEYLGTYAGFDGRRAGIHATAALNREDWGLTWNVALESGGWLVGKEIKLDIDLAFDEVVAAEPLTDAVIASA